MPSNPIPSSDPVAQDPFHRLFFERIHKLICAPPSRKNLFDLLTQVEPDLTIENFNKDPAAGQKALKKLKLRVHPDKHQNSPYANKIFQEIDNFYKSCMLKPEISTGSAGGEGDDNDAKRRRVQKNKFPKKFHIEQDGWNWVDIKNIDRPMNKEYNRVNHDLAVLYENIRCTIVHGRKIGNSRGDIKEHIASPIAKIFEEEYEGFCYLETIDEIKNEVMTRGPVVSTSFSPTSIFMKQPDIESSWFTEFKNSKTVSHYPVLIVGWHPEAYGEVWDVVGVQPDSKFSVVFGQFGIDDTLLVAASEFEDEKNQDRPYIVRNVFKKRKKGTICGFKMNKISDLRNFIKSLENGKLSDVFQNKVEVCKVGKKSKSQTAILKDLIVENDDLKLVLKYK